MNDLLGRLNNAFTGRHDLLTRFKKYTGKKIIGYFCTNTPEEIIYAAGLIPVRIQGGNKEIDAADGLFQIYVCSYAKSCLDLGLRGQYVFWMELSGRTAAIPYCGSTASDKGIFPRHSAPL